MPPFTRSRRNDTFASDVAGKTDGTRVFRDGLHLNARTKELTTLKIKRPNVHETECTVRVDMPVNKAIIKAVFVAMQQRALIDVVALDTRTNTLYNRGSFRIEKVTRHAVVLVKAWSPTTSHSPDNGDGNVTKKAVVVAPAAVAPAVIEKNNFVAVAATAPPPRPTVTVTTTTPVADSSTSSGMLVRNINTAIRATACTKVYTRPVQGAVPFAGFVFRAPAPAAAAVNVSQDARAPPPSPPPLPVPRRSIVAAAATATGVPTTTTTTTFMPQAIPTIYKNVQYRSRLEARFAHLLDELHVRFVYEPMAYRLASGSTYTIDFFFPDQQLYVELKPRRPHIEEEYKCEQMSVHGFRVTLLYGSALHKPPFRSELFNGRSHRDYAHHDALRGITWINGKKLAGDTVFVVGRHATFRTPLDLAPPTTPDDDADAGDDANANANANAVHLNQLASVLDERWHHPSITAAFAAIMTPPPASRLS